MANKNVYYFGKKGTESKNPTKELFGGKGANLMEMTKIGLPVPPGFTITTEMCIEYYNSGKTLPEYLNKEVLDAVKKIEADTNKTFGKGPNPLLVSVRSGARASMPGMMDTILNLGLNDETAEAMAKATGNERFVYDSYRRFIQMYSNVVMDMDSSLLEEILVEAKNNKGVKFDTELDTNDLKTLAIKFKAKYKEINGTDFPTDPYKQLFGAVSAVFASWNNERAIFYRKQNGFSDDWGTAVTVQTMVFGNMGDDCATGVAFTRNPATGANHYYGEFLINAQGEDVVAGIRTPQPINASSQDKDNPLPTMEEVLPSLYTELANVFKTLEKHYKDMQDIEFTVEKGHLYLLQTRTGKRTARAAVKIACDMLDENFITEKEAVLRVAPEQVDQLLHPMLDPNAQKEELVKGLPASPGAATGKIVFTPQDAEDWTAKGEKVILVRHETSPEDIKGMAVSEGILTATGGMTSHAAVVARGMGKCCIAGCGDIKVTKKNFTLNGKTYKEGDIITLDGSTGNVYNGDVPKIKPELSGDFGRIMTLADKYRTINVRTNADTPHDSQVAKDFGAEGIGLCRTEHMFFEGDRVVAVREMILSANTAERENALNKIKPMQIEDFKGLFKVMKGFPVTIRLLDPPLHEFLPHTDKEMIEVSKAMGVNVDILKEKAEALHELNPMLGHRGCRLGISYPEIYKMQVEAVITAACELVKNEGMTIEPEIMIPLIGKNKELQIIKKYCIEVVEKTMAKYATKLNYKIGTMIELPRAAITAGEIANTAEFFSFGTNDLTQTTLGLSRDDAGNFLPEYVDKKIYAVDPFVSIDQEGVGELVKWAVKSARTTKPGFKIGVCGEHGGDPKSVEFFHRIGLNYVSCSPYRVPVARLAAAHAALKYGETNQTTYEEPRATV